MPVASGQAPSAFHCLASGVSRSGHKQTDYVAKYATSPVWLMPVAPKRRLQLFLLVREA